MIPQDGLTHVEALEPAFGDKLVLAWTMSAEEAI